MSFVRGKFDCFMFCFSFHLTHKNCFCHFQTDCYVFSCEFSNANGWVDEVEFKVKAGAGLGGHDEHWPSGWEVCTGDPDGTSCLPDI